MSGAPPRGGLGPARQAASTLPANLGFGLAFGFLLAASRDLLGRRGHLMPGDLVVIAFVAALSYGCASYYVWMRSWAAQSVAGGRREASGKGDGWAEQIQQSDRLAWAMIAYGLLAYLSTCMVLAIVVPWVRRLSMPGPTVASPLFANFILRPAFWSPILIGIACAWSLGCLDRGAKLFHLLARRWLPPGSLAGPDPAQSIRGVYDRDLDHPFGPEPRPVS